MALTWAPETSGAPTFGLPCPTTVFTLGNLGAVNHDDLRTLICEATPILNDCESILKVEMRPVSGGLLLQARQPDGRPGLGSGWLTHFVQEVEEIL